MKQQGFLALALLCAAGAAQAGVVVEMAERDVRSGKTQGVDRLTVQGGAARIEEVVAGARASDYTLFRDDVIYNVRPAERSYIAMDRKGIAAMAGKMNAAMAQARAQMANMPPEQRAMMEKMMGGMPGAPAKPAAPLVARDTGRSDSVGSRSCRVWEMTRGGQVEEQLCVVPFSEVPGKEDLLALSRRMAELMRAMSEAMPALGDTSRDIEAMNAVRGYPIRIRSYEKGKPMPTETVLQSWREENVAPALLQVPAGYRRQDPMQGGDD